MFLHDLGPRSGIQLLRILDEEIRNPVLDAIAAARVLVRGNKRVPIQHERGLGKRTYENLEQFLADRHKDSFAFGQAGDAGNGKV
jgi:hypothetical protein